MQRQYLITIPLLCVGFVILAAFNWTHKKPIDTAPVCAQPPKLVLPPKFANSSRFFEPSYSDYSASVLGGAVRIPTESFDDMAQDPADEPRMAPLAELHQYLFSEFPLSAEHAEVINTYGLFYTFKGSDSSLKPALYMSHMDVVPVNKETRDQWEYDPFGGYFDGEWVHGRGASDTKNTVVGILEAVEALLQQKWAPKRTILLAYGFDEEISGFRGAGHLAAEIEQRYGQDSLEIIVDEGFGNLESDGLRLACPLVTERGYLDVHFEIDTPGGHSSLPPKHTGIGIAAALIAELEDHPFAPSIHDWRAHPAVGLFQCIAEHSPEFSASQRARFLDLDTPKNLLDLTEYISAKGGATQFMIRTSQAVDLVSGGVKVNALPELVKASVNYRISLDESVRDVLEHVRGVALGVAQEYDVGLVEAEAKGKGAVLAYGALGNITISTGIPLEPAPIAPWTGPQWDLLAGVMRRVFEDLVPMDEPLRIAPSMMTGNTDTRHYWNLSSHIYRYSPVDQRDLLNYHTVNERIRLRAHLATVAWFYELTQHLSL